MNHKSTTSLSLGFVMLYLLTASGLQARDSAAKQATDDTLSLMHLLPQGLAETYEAYVDQVMRSAEALPRDVRTRMLRLVGRPGIPFNHDDIESARFIPAATPQGSILFPVGMKMTGITHGQLIIMSSEAIHPSDCNGYAVWAHELTHIAQNRRDGRNYFLRKYLADATKYDYPKIPYELDAYRVQDAVIGRYCTVMERATGEEAKVRHRS